MRSIVVSFYTAEEYYRNAAEELRRDCNRLGIGSEIVEVPIRPNETWLDICRRKVPFFLEMHRKHNRPIFWLDADSRLGKRLDVLDGATSDVAAFLRGTRYLRDFDPLAMPRFFAPYALFFNATPRARAFLELMADLEARFEGAATDDFFLQEAWEQHSEQLTVMILPPDLVGREWPLRNREAIYVGISGNVPSFKRQAEQHPVPLLESARRRAVLVHEAGRALEEGSVADAICLYRRALDLARDDRLVRKIAHLMRRDGRADEAADFLRRHRGGNVGT